MRSFYKSDKSRGIDKTGVGLGMYIARTIIEAQGEKIWVESEQGKWCRFTFTLPAAKAPERQKGQTQPLSSPDDGRNNGRQ